MRAGQPSSADICISRRKRDVHFPRLHLSEIKILGQKRRNPARRRRNCRVEKVISVMDLFHLVDYFFLFLLLSK